LAPTYKQMADLVYKSARSKDITIAKMDADKHREEAKKHGIKGYPTIKLFIKGQEVPIDFNGRRDVKGFLDFLHKELDESDTTI
jgi:protein disulfide-isomerase A6